MSPAGEQSAPGLTLTRSRPTAVDFIANLANGALGLILILGVVLPSALGLLFRAHHLPDLLRAGPTQTGLVIIFGAMAFVPLIAAAYALRARKEPGMLFISVVLALSLLARLLFVLPMEEALTSDYKTMWEFALSYIDNDHPRPAASIQEYRSLMYLVPMALVSDGSRLAVEIVNAFLTIACGLFVYWLAREHAGHRAGVAALILAIFSPEPIFSSEVTTHDIPGTFFMLAGIYWFFRVLRNWTNETDHYYRVLLHIFMGSIALALAEFQRSTGIFIYAALITALFIKICAWKGFMSSLRSRHGLILLSLVLMPPLASGAIKSVLFSCCADESAINKISKYATWGWIASYSGPDSVGDYPEYRESQATLNKMRPADLPGYALNKVADEYHADPSGIFRHYKRKAERLYNLGRQGGEYYGSSPHRQLFDAYNGFYAIALLSLTVTSFFILALDKTHHPASLFPILVIAWLSTALIAVGEIQSRYIFGAWYILPLYLVMAYSACSNKQCSLTWLRQRAIKSLMPLALLIPTAILSALVLIYTFRTD